MILNLKSQKDKSISYLLEEKNFSWKIFPTGKISPVTISCPHDGLKAHDLMGFVIYKTMGCKGYDNRTWSLVKGIAYHTPINLIRGMLPRHFLDYNRYVSLEDFKLYSGELFEETEIACEDSNLIKYHAFYHNSLIGSVSSADKIYGSKAKFFDFHGFSKQPPYGEYDIILGTSNRKTIKSDLDIEIAIGLRNLGYNVFWPQKDKKVVNKEDWYDAGFTTRNVFLKTGVDSIQIEVHCSIRMDEKKAYKFSEDFSKILDHC